MLRYMTREHNTVSLHGKKQPAPVKVDIMQHSIAQETEVESELPILRASSVRAEHEDTAAFAVGRTIARAASRVRPP